MKSILTMAWAAEDPSAFDLAAKLAKMSPDEMHAVRIGATQALRDKMEGLVSRADATKALIDSGKLSLDGLITHHQEAASAPDAYRIAFEDPACLKMVLNWRPS